MPIEPSPVSEADALAVSVPAGPQAEVGAVIDDGGAQSYLNADERTGVALNGKTNFTIDRAGLQLVGINPKTGGPQPGWNAHAGEAYTVTYAFRATAPAQMPSDTAGFQQFNSLQIHQAELALQAWADVANITFVRVGSGDGLDAYSDNASILFGNYSTGEAGSAAFANYPGDPDPSSKSGDVWVNVNAGTNSFPQMGNYGAQVLVHEIGHAIGMAHPGKYNAGENVTITYSANAEYYEDSRQYTVMSYFSETNTGGSYNSRYASAPQLDDIRAAQIEYGANMTTRTDDTVYGFHSTADREWYAAASSSSKVIFAVWDAGGNDTLDFSGYSQNQTIDLREGNFSNVGGLVGNVAIAQGAQIENAIGGFGSDTLYGNALDNQLTGNNGADTMYGGDGADSLDGGSGQSYLRGEDGDDSIAGGSSFDDINGNAGADTESGGGGDDWVVGGKGNDLMFADEGNDLVYGNLGDDSCVGGAGNDTVRGGQGDDYVAGGDGNDFVSGDLGSDTMIGGAGADTFHSFVGAGVDRILDFNLDEGDRLMLDPGTTFSAAQVGADTVVTLGDGGGEVILAGVTLSTLTPGWVFGA